MEILLIIILMIIIAGCIYQKIGIYNANGKTVLKGGNLGETPITVITAG